MLAVLLVLTACHSPRREAMRMVARAEALADTLPDSTARLIDSVLRMPVYFSERQRMEMALLQGEALFSDAPLDDDSFEDTAYRVATSPELERAAGYYAKKKRYAKAAHAALYSGYVQQHYNEKEAAMRSYKDAEQYGLLSNDSLTVARAEYRMGKMMYYEGRKQEALSFFNESINNIGNRLADLATIENGRGASHIFLNHFDSAEMCFQQSFLYAEESKSLIAKHKALNNFAVLYRLQGEYEKAVDCLQQINHDTCLNSTEVFMSSLNLGMVFFDMKEMDSAAYYYRIIEDRLSRMPKNKQSQLATYDALYKFAERQNNDSLALLYREKHEDVLYAIMLKRQEQNMYRVQHQYNYEYLQNKMSKKVIQKHRIILITSILLLFSFSIIIVLQYRSKQLLETKKAMRQQIDTMKQELQQSVKSSYLEQELSSHIRLILFTHQIAKQSKDPKKEWTPIVYHVMNGKDSVFEAVETEIEKAYPGIYSSLCKKYPNLNETETKVCLLSCCDLSNTEISEILELSLHTVNKNRSKLRSKLKLSPEKMQEQLRKALSN